jgi:hypothetical protein
MTANPKYIASTRVQPGKIVFTPVNYNSFWQPFLISTATFFIVISVPFVFVFTSYKRSTVQVPVQYHYGDNSYTYYTVCADLSPAFI